MVEITVAFVPAAWHAALTTSLSQASPMKTCNPTASNAAQIAYYVQLR